MWWVWDAPEFAGAVHRGLSGMGAGGSTITVLPELDMVIAHKTDTSQASPHGQDSAGVPSPGREYEAIVRMLISARPAVLPRAVTGRHANSCRSPRKPGPVTFAETGPARTGPGPIRLHYWRRARRPVDSVRGFPSVTAGLGVDWRT